MADVGGLLYDKDAVYIDIPDWKVMPRRSPCLLGTSNQVPLKQAPMADVGGLLYHKDAVYIDIPDWKVQDVASPAEQAPIRQLQSEPHM